MRIFFRRPELVVQPGAYLPKRSISQPDRSIFQPRALDSSDPTQRFGTLQPQEVILGLFGEYVRRDEEVWSGGLVTLLGDLHFSAAASRIALNRVVARGLLSRSKEGRFVHYVITPKLEAVHEEGRRQVFYRSTNVETGKEWTLVWYSIPEEVRAERGRLSRWLNFRGFGALQDGTWIAAGNRQDDTIRLIERLKLTPYVVTFVGKLPSQFDIRNVVDKAWNLEELRKMYDIFMSRFADYGQQKIRSGLDSREAFVLRTRVIEIFREIVAHDPNLPDVILKVDWRRREAIDLFQKLQSELKPAATDYFRSHTITEGS